MDNYDPEYLIAAVKKRPFLYDKFATNYNDRTAKIDGWMQVAQEVTENWNDLDTRERELRARELQSKWRNMRDNFRREIIDKQSNRDGLKKKRKYRYFQDLIFLLPQFKNRYNISKFIPADAKDNNEEVTESTLPCNKRGVRKFAALRNVPNKIRKTQGSTVNTNPPKASTSWTDENEVRDFCRSLVPSLSKLDDEDRLSAKIEILSVLRSFSIPRHLRLNPNIMETPTFNTFPQSSNMESMHTQMNPLSPLQTAQDSPINNHTQNTTEPRLSFEVDISHIKSDVNDG